MTIRERADRLLEQTALMELLSPCGAVIVGSCAMDAMTWNDLDIYVDTGDIAVEKWFALAADVMRVLQPVRMDGFVDAAAGKYFFGAETTVSGERWNVDIWGKTAAEIADAQRSNAEMKARFDADPAAKAAMIAIKRGLIDRGMYGFDKGKVHYHSPEIYDAVLEKGVRTLEEFLNIE